MVWWYIGTVVLDTHIDLQIWHAFVSSHKIQHIEKSVEGSFAVGDGKQSEDWGDSLVLKSNENGWQSQVNVVKPRRYFHFTKALYGTDGMGNPRVVSVMTSLAPLESGGGDGIVDTDTYNFHSSTMWGFTKALKNENVQANIKLVQLVDNRLDEYRLNEIYYELWNCDKELQVAYHGNSRYVPKLLPYKGHNTALKLPNGTDSFCLTWQSFVEVNK